MSKCIHILFLLFFCAGKLGWADESSPSTVFRVAIEDVAPQAKVLGVETCYGLVVAAQKIQNVIKPKNVKAEEIINADILLLKNGRRIDVRDVDYLYVKSEAVVTAMTGQQGKHPNTDEGASGSH